MRPGKKAKKLVDDFTRDAMSHGWEKDQGTAPDALEALKNFDTSKAELEKYIIGLQDQIRKLKALNKVHGWVQPGVH